MSGDGVNDAPALRQAEAGIAMANATDVAKAAAAIVLTRPGLGDVLPALEASRRVFQRVLTYTLNMLSKKIEMMLLLVAGFLLTGHKVLTPLLMVLIIFLNDFLTMALATDRMSISAQPNPWRTRPIVIAGALRGLLRLGFTFGVFAYGHYALHFDTPHAQSLIFASIIIGSQAGVYLLRERGPFWASRPSGAMVWSTLLALVIMAFISLSGLYVPAVGVRLLAAVAAGAIVYFLALDGIKVRLFAWLQMR